jgi:hypothetical protein
MTIVWSSLAAHVGQRHDARIGANELSIGSLRERIDRK